MSIDVARAWKDPVYRMSLTEAERASLPENPVGLVELDMDDLAGITGGYEAALTRTICCSIPGSVCCECEKEILNPSG